MSAEQPPPAPPDRTLVIAVAAAILLVVLAAGGGLMARYLVNRPAPLPSPTAAPVARPSPTEPPDTEPLVFMQPLSAGCAAGDAVYVVSDGGGIGRFAFGHWQLIDPVARSLGAAMCRGDELIAVGGGGRVVTISDQQQTIRSDAVQLDDFLGVAPLGGGLLAVGRSGTVQLQTAGGWNVYAQGLDEDLYAVAAFGSTSAWVVGAGGASYRLEPAGWRPVATGITATLRAIAAPAADDAVVVGDDATILIWRGAWARVEAPVRANFRAALRIDNGTYIAGDNGTLLRLSGDPAAPVFAQFDLGTSCTLRALFRAGGDLWIIGSDGGRSAVWRIGPAGTFHWGQCQ